MKRPSRIALGLLLLATACDQTDPPDVAETPVAAPETVAAAPAGDGHAAGEHEGQALLPIMQHLGSQMNALTYALMTEDSATVASSAAAIAAHAPIAADEMERLQRELGPDMAVFEALDESVHVASVQLHDAAKSGREDVVVERLGDVQRGCVACHTRFRERLVASRGAAGAE